MKKNSNAYIIIYATVMVVVVAAVLAVAAMMLQPIQDVNVEVERKSTVLASVGLGQYKGKAGGKAAFIDDEYSKYIREIEISTASGDKLPLIESTGGGKKLYVIPVTGTGLWGPIWGYVALREDWNTIEGVVFDHKGETPGLGDKIIKPLFRNQFAGKQLFEGPQFVGISVLKGKGASKGNNHAVDAVSGGTITSRGVERMIRATLEKYLPYIEQQKRADSAVALGAVAGEPAAEIDNTENSPRR